MNAILKKLTETLEARKKDDPSKSYTASLYRDGLEAILKKVEVRAVLINLLPSINFSISGAEKKPYISFA